MLATWRILYQVADAHQNYLPTTPIACDGPAKINDFASVLTFNISPEPNVNVKASAPIFSYSANRLQNLELEKTNSISTFTTTVLCLMLTKKSWYLQYRNCHCNVVVDRTVMNHIVKMWHMFEKEKVQNVDFGLNDRYFNIVILQ